MKTLFISLLLMCSLSSCDTSSFVTSGVSSEPSYRYDAHYITYNYGYIFYDVHCPVLYINGLPWYYYHGVWYVVPPLGARYIKHYRVGQYCRISTFPPHRHAIPVYHPSHRGPGYGVNHNHGHNNGHKPGTHKPNTYKPTYNPNAKPHNGRPSQHYNRSMNRPTRNSNNTNRR